VSGSVTADTADGGRAAGPSDEQLLERLAAGPDERALSDLYDRYQAQMYGLAMRITRDPALAQDAVQEAFVGVWRNAARYAVGRSTVRTWMLSIAHHRAIDIVRRRRPTTTLPEIETAEPALTAPDVWPEVAQTLDRDTVTSAMAMLPDVQREAIQLAYFEGLTQVEIAERTGTPLGTVKSRVRLGLLAMRRTLEGEGAT
jgi:RNA polymerase sigma-70 factor (ECF subfamily)